MAVEEKDDNESFTIDLSTQQVELQQIQIPRTTLPHSPAFLGFPAQHTLLPYPPLPASPPTTTQPRLETTQQPRMFQVPLTTTVERQPLTETDTETEDLTTATKIDLHHQGPAKSK